MVDGDVPFVRDSWLRSAWYLEDKKLKARGLKKRDRIRAGISFYDAIRPHVTMLLRDAAVSIVVACERDDANYIAGWIALRTGGEEIRLYVKQAYRPWGVDEMLRLAAREVL